MLTLWKITAKRKSGSIVKKEENCGREKKWKQSKKRPKVVTRDAVGFARHLKIFAPLILLFAVPVIRV